MDIVNSIITASSTLFGVGVTLYFSNRREKNKFIQDVQLKEITELESFYVSLLSSIDMNIRYTLRGDDYKDLFKENAINSAKANLIAPKIISEKLGVVNEAITVWSSFYIRSLPTKLGDTGLGMVTNKDSENRAKAEEVFVEVQTEFEQLVNLIREELKFQKDKLKR